ncbi:MFS general substrate transporter [Penicillium taxi]|uniref:MFS general substrate transporter n=1 Tax=Penicillium taxi TaxID=168475 RepID=UPI002545A7A1|nr:MFS general substrate transporter [Penicillium taxi]KAJ5902007.1 MFS general substrate transporter [Penicillium taxi]
MSTLQLALRDLQLELDPDSGYIRWASTNPKHPRNWRISRKIYDIGLITLLEFYTYLLGQGIGGIIFPPYSECFGRKRLYIGSTVLYSGLCAMIGAVESPAAAVVGRFVTGVLSAIPTSIITGSIEDMFNSKARIWMMLSYIGVANMGVAMGPVMGTYITLAWGWYDRYLTTKSGILLTSTCRNWIFYVAAIVTAAIAFLLLSIRESRPSLLLEREVDTLRKQTGMHSLEAFNPDSVPDWQKFVKNDLFRPVRLLFTEPIVFAVSIMGGTAMAIIYLFTEALPTIYQAMGLSQEKSSLPFLAIGLGFLFNIPGRILEYQTANAYCKEKHSLSPEHKLKGLVFAAPALAAALWCFAWTIPPNVHNVHWIFSVISLLVVGYGRNEIAIVLTGYMANSYLSYSSSAFAANALMRSILSATFPLFAPMMFKALGANVSVSILASTMTVFSVIPLLFQRHGKSIRERSKFAQYSMSMYEKTTVEKDGS